MHLLNPAAWPWLLLAPLAVALVWLARRRNRQIVSACGNSRHQAQYDRSGTARAYALKATLAALAVVAAGAALMRPSVPNAVTEFPAGKADVVVLVDASRSMGAKDCRDESRLRTARQVLRHGVLPSLNNNRVGLISYAGKAVPRVFLTPEVDTVAWLIDNGLDISSTPGEGSALGRAFDLAFRFFDVDSKADPKTGQSEREKYIILLSDGGIDDDTRVEAIVAGCNKRKVKLIVLGLGQPVLTRIPISELPLSDQRLSAGPFYQIEGQDAKTALDENILQGLAKSVNDGIYARVTHVSEVSFPRLVSGVEMQKRVSERELFWYPMLACWVLVLACFVVTARGTTRASERSL